VWVPAGHVAQRINDDLVGYLGVTTPFGLVTDYPDTGVTRYVATLSNLITINVNPGLAMSLKRWIPGLSIGAGFNAQYARAHLNRNLLFGAPPDVIIQVAGEDWAFGWNAGILYEFDEHARIGLSYRSQTSHKLSGFVQAISTGTGATIFRGGATAGATFPDLLTLSGYWEPMPRTLPGFALLADFLWAQWSRFQVLKLNFTGVPLPNTAQPFDFRDAFRGSLGFQYKFTDRATFRFGSGFDGSPVSDSNRTLQLPDANRVLLGVGFGYEVAEGVIFDLGYLHLFVPNGRINQTNESADHSNFTGHTDSSTDVIGGQLTWNYDSFPPRLPFGS
jgi:long-chain fatty acid transport protein